MPTTEGFGFVVRDRAAYLPAADALVLADLHLGRAAAANVALPIEEASAPVERLDRLVDEFDPAEVVLAGDVLHAFSRLPAGVERTIGRLRERVEAVDATLTVVEGNHDVALDAAAESVPEHRLADGTLVCHGHEEPAATADRYVVGHDHPAIAVEGRRRPCYLYGEGVHRGADVLCLPAFDRLAPGTEVNRLRPDDAASSLLSDLDAFRPIVRDAAADETYVFPRLSDLREFL